MKIFIIIFSFFVVFSFQAKLIKIDMQINNNEIYTIQNMENNIDCSFLYKLNVKKIPEQILNLIIQTLINNNIMEKCVPNKYREHITFFCSRKPMREKINNVNLNFMFDNCTKFVDISGFFSRTNNVYFIGISSKPLKKNKNLRLLSSLNETEIKKENNNNNTNANHNINEQEVKEKKGKSGIGWLGISLIILLSLIVIYVIYVGFRYYRRKKYQNPSFYYKITEEMFDDITPIE